MTKKLAEEIKKISGATFADAAIRKKFFTRTEEGNLTRDENSASHFCIYFFPYNPILKKVFIVHHKKSGLWLSPGGHIDKGENLIGTLRREINEELGIKNIPKKDISPLLLTITPIENPSHPCKIHFDIWYTFPTSGSNFHINPAEFYKTKWLAIPEARKLVTDLPNLQALTRIEEIF